MFYTLTEVWVSFMRVHLIVHLRPVHYSISIFSPNLPQSKFDHFHWFMLGVRKGIESRK